MTKSKYFLNNKINLLLLIIYMTFLRLLFSGSITDCYCLHEYIREPVIKILSDSYLYDLDNNLIVPVYGPENKKLKFDLFYLLQFSISSLSERQERKADYFVKYMSYYLSKDPDEDSFKTLTIIQGRSHSMSDIDKHMVRNCYYLLVYLSLMYHIPAYNEPYFTYTEVLEVLYSMEVFKLANLLQIVMEHEVSINNNYFSSFKEINLYLLYKFPEKYIKY